MQIKTLMMCCALFAGQAAQAVDAADAAPQMDPQKQVAVIDSVVAPTSSRTSTRNVPATCTVMFSRIKVLNPGTATVIE